MFFFLSKVLRFLLTPVSWILLLCVLAVWKKRATHWYLLLGSMLFFTNPYIPEQLLKAWEYDPVDISDRHFSVAIVLTGMTKTSIQIPGQMQFSDGADRLLETLKLYKKGQVDKILISGGSGSLTHPEWTESPSLAQFAMEMGIPSHDIIIESQSRNTNENALFSAEMIQSNPELHGEILLVTSAFHMRRSIGCFKKRQVTFTPYPVDYYIGEEVAYDSFIPSSDALEHWERLISEWIGYLMYRIMGYL